MNTVISPLEKVKYLIDENPLALSSQAFTAYTENPFAEHHGVSARSLERAPILACQEEHKSGKPFHGHFNQSVKIAGNVFTAKKFDESLWKGKRKKKKPKRDEYGLFPETTEKAEPKIITSEEKEENRKKSGRHAKETLIDILNSNFGMMTRQNKPGQKSVKFFTGTVAANLTDLDEMLKMTQRFIDRLEYELDEKVDYVAVPELQDRGAWHVHIIFYCSFISMTWLKENWNKERGEGSFDISRIQDVANIGKYVGKYVSKTLDMGGEVFAGRHRYWCSKGLKNAVKKLYAKIYDLSEIGRSKTGWNFKDFLEYFKGFIVKIRQGVYSGVWTGAVEFLELTLQPCEETRYLLSAFIESFI